MEDLVIRNIRGSPASTSTGHAHFNAKNFYSDIDHVDTTEHIGAAGDY